MDEEKDLLEPDTGDESGQDLTPDPEEERLTQADVNRIVESRLARDRVVRDKQMREAFGTADMREAADYYKAGRAVAESTQRKPHEIIQGAQQFRQNTAPQQQQEGVPVELTQKVDRIEQILTSERQEATRKIQREEAKREFGKLYDEHEVAILDKAEDLPTLTLAEVAAIVLKGKMRSVVENKVKTEQDVLRQRKVEGSTESPKGGGEDFSGKLSNEERRVARKMGLTDKDYFESKQLNTPRRR